MPESLLKSKLLISDDIIYQLKTLCLYVISICVSHLLHQDGRVPHMMLEFLNVLLWIVDAIFPCHQQIDSEFEASDVDENFVHPEAHEYRVGQHVDESLSMDVDSDLVDGEGAEEMVELRDSIIMQLQHSNRFNTMI